MGDKVTKEATVLKPVPSLDETELQTKVDENMEVTVGDKTVKVYVQQVIKKSNQFKLDVLFLHGNAFSSKNWTDLKTTDHVANWGYRAIAIDLPGKGRSSSVEVEPDKFLEAFISKLQMTNIVIIAPSMSGRYALPYLFNEPTKVSETVKGFVAVAPVETETYESKYSASQIPTLIVYGSNDKAISTFLPNLEKLPKHTTAEIKDAGHACYLNKPEEFHKILYNFLLEVSS
ncbi:putative protein-lysine deacylase ABHD14B isoform X2 [Biomphalaria glabrata]|nr:putative protein-lysine deacylase ABHD14B isoform X2 [Biomphalaria glabrata]XP_055897096.1 putative protein-lysine deacylase ABHD14B isoform X2 [Biomphalaria glabrata]